MEQDVLTLHTSLSPCALRNKLRFWGPWSHRVDFDNGVSTRDFARRGLFSESPLRKFRCVGAAIPFNEFRGGRLLDIGCNVGHNSINAALKYEFSALGIDVVCRYVEAARFSCCNSRRFM
jgi:2-polyprenyl-3-methyl-5-hydroxy-6-metoxy-1,4-benzoquinol methylase